MTDPVESQPQKPDKARNRLAPLLIVALLMGAEGVAVFVLAKAIGAGPVSALAAEGDGGAAGPAEGTLAEIELAECRPSNSLAGRFITFHIRVSALVAAEDLERARQLVRAKRARLEDGVNTVIRSAEPKHFNEPRYDTIKRRLKEEFDRIFGDDDLVKEVLIPQMLQSGPGL